MNSINIHITVELQPSPQLVQLLQELRPGGNDGCGRAPRKPSMPSMGETESLLHPGPEAPMTELGKFMKELKERKKLKDPDPDPNIYLLEEIEPFTKTKLRDLPHINSTLGYCDAGDALCIKYYSTYVWTTWTSILKLHSRFGNSSKQRNWGPLLRIRDASNRRMAVSYFLRAISAGLKPGQGSPRELEDPDADFRPHLKGVIDTSTRYDGGKLEGTLEG